jgi:16S rRNA U1498 N3-methylase RsmE
MIKNKENCRPLLESNEKSLTKRKSLTQKSIKTQLKNTENDHLSLSYWDLPEKIIKKYNEIGVERMFEWQAECLQSGQALSTLIFVL